MKKLLVFMGIFALILPLLFLGCEGDDGAQGIQGEQGEQGPPGPGVAAQAESCGICHGGNPERDGAGHQAIYDMYTDAPTLAVTIDDVVSIDNGTVGFFNVTMTFTITDTTKSAGLSLAEFEALDQSRFFATLYDNTTMQFFEPVALNASTATDLGGGQFSVVLEGVPYAPEDSNAFVYMYVARDELDTEAVGRAHYALYNDVVNVGQAFGDVSYLSAANVTGCEKCHGTPYQKHGYRAAVAAGLPDFVACKACHYDDRTGSHEDWQILVTDPSRFAEIFAGDDLTPAEETQYAYTANIMNDVHMSHAMEFPYPQSMSTCVTCHDTKLDMILTDANFTFETCKSCHAVTGDGNAKQAPSLEKIWLDKNVTSIHESLGPAATCADFASCHLTGGAGKSFGAIHTGYDDEIYTAAGQKFADAITVSVDNATLVGTDLTIEFSASGAAGGLDSADMAPAVLIGLYGYDTKDFIVNGHDRWDSNCNGITSRNDGDSPKGEYVVGEAEVPGCPNPYFTLVSGGPGAGPWVITAHLGAEAEWADMINDGTIKRVEIAVLPELENTDGEQVPLNAASRTFVLATGAFDDDFFAHKVVNVDNCNKCHDQLATTFHSGARGGSVVVCRMCHVKLSGGSHLEMQSRSIDSYVHAIHSFQDFDIGDIDFDDPVEATMYQLHIEHTFPNFTIMNCESCHNALVNGSEPYNVPDQSKSLPGLLSGSDPDVVFNNITLPFLANGPRNIGDVPSYIVGPAAAACGGCHRAHAINEDNAGELASLFSHWGSFGSLVEAGAPPNDIFTVIDDIFSAL